MMEDFAYSIAENIGVVENSTPYANQKEDVYTISDIGNHVPVFGQEDTIFRSTSEVRRVTAAAGTETETTAAPNLQTILSKHSKISKLDKMWYLAEMAQDLYAQKTSGQII